VRWKKPPVDLAEKGEVMMFHQPLLLRGVGNSAERTEGYLRRSLPMLLSGAVRDVTGVMSSSNVVATDFLEKFRESKTF
jgi:hypothetical protein